MHAKPYEIDPGQMYVQRIADEIVGTKNSKGVIINAGMTGTRKNRDYLKEKLDRFDPHTQGFDPEVITKELQTVTLDINWVDEVRGRRSYNSRIGAAVINAGQNLFHDLVATLESDEKEGLEKTYGHKEAVLALASYFGGDRQEEYTRLADNVWDETQQRVLTPIRRGILNAGKEHFDPRTTPNEVETRYKNLEATLDRYHIQGEDIFIDPDKDTFFRDLYRQAYEALVPLALDQIEVSNARGVDDNHVTITLKELRENMVETYQAEAKKKGLKGDKIDEFVQEKLREEPHDVVDSTIADIHKVLLYGYRAGIDVEELRKLKQEMLEINEWDGAKKTDLGRTMYSQRFAGLPITAEYVKQRGQELMETPVRIHTAIESAMEEVEKLNDPNARYERVPTPSFDSGIPKPKDVVEEQQRITQEVLDSWNDIALTYEPEEVAKKEQKKLSFRENLREIRDMILGPPK
jgi:hypothetical protein